MAVCTACADPPGPPRNLRIENVTGTSCTLVWEAPSFDGDSEIKGYYIERSSGYSSRFVKVNRDPINRTQQTYNDLVPGTEYEYRVLAENKAGISKPSETTGVFIAKDPYSKAGKPGTPTVKEITKDSVMIEWEAPESDGGAEITSYVVEARHASVLHRSHCSGVLRYFRRNSFTAASIVLTSHQRA